jgi:hypothetical protein
MKRIIIFSLIFVFAGSTALAVGAQNGAGSPSANPSLSASPSHSPSPSLNGTPKMGQSDDQNDDQEEQDDDQGKQIQNELQTQNQGEEQQLQNQLQTQETAGKTIQVNLAERQSMVAQAVQGLLDLANMEPRIGEKIRVIAQEQNQAQEKIDNQINTIQTRNKVKTFLFGTDYKSANELRKEMTATENQINELNQLKEQIQNENHAIILQDQVGLLEQEKNKIQAFVNDNEDKFSLFGWFIKIFVK